MSPTLANMLFEVANFLLLAGLLGWLLFKPVRKMLDREREQHGRAQAELERLRSEAEALAKDAEGARDKSARELEERRSELLAAAQKEAAALLEQAKQTELAERRALAKERETARAADATELSELIGRIAGESVRTLLVSVGGPSLDLALLRAVTPQLSALPEEVRKAALVESAAPLETAAQELLKRALGDGFRQRVAPELGAGLRISTEAGQVDASALSVARTAARLISETNTPPPETSTNG